MMRSPVFSSIGALIGSSSAACMASALSGLTMGSLLIARDSSVWTGAFTAAIGSVPFLIASLALRREPRLAIGWFSRFARESLETLRVARALPLGERLLATAFLCGCFLYIEVLTEFDVDHAPGFALVAPVAIVALVFGFDCGLASAMGLTFAHYVVFVPPRFTFWFNDWRDLGDIGVFLVLSICGSLIFQVIFRVSDDRLRH